MKSENPQPELVPLLEKHGISWALFSKKGRLSNDLKWVSGKRSDIITEMHSKGTSWSDMIRISGLSLGSIERLTKAMWNDASRKNSSENGAKTEWVLTPKGSSEKTFARSSYEVSAIVLLEADTQVVRYEHEHRFILSDGRWVLPDFLIEYADGSTLLVEVKASWVLNLPSDHKVQQRLQISRQLAESHGWGFGIWTERELKNVNKSAD